MRVIEQNTAAGVEGTAAADLVEAAAAGALRSLLGDFLLDAFLLVRVQAAVVRTAVFKPAAIVEQLACRLSLYACAFLLDGPLVMG